MSYESVTRNHNDEINRYIHTYSTFLRNILLKSVQHNILQHDKNVSTSHGYTDGGNEQFTSSEQSTLLYLQFIVSAAKWLHLPHENIAPSQIRNPPKISRPPLYTKY
jgi:hypothetical protein